jgi:hypothetical protein
MIAGEVRTLSRQLRGSALAFVLAATAMAAFAEVGPEPVNAWREGYRQVCLDWEREEAASRYFAQMEKALKQFPNSPIAQGYHAAAGLILANHGWSPLSKWQAFTRYRDQLEQAIRQAPSAADLRLIRLGVLRNGAHARELAELLKETFSAKTLEKGIFSMGSEWLQKVYGFGDDFWKVIGFENEKADLMKYRGMSEVEAEIEAARIIQAKYPSYFNAPRFVTWLRRNIFLAAFPTFTAEIIRNALSAVLSSLFGCS